MCYKFFFDQFYMTQALRHQKLKNVCERFLLTNIKSELSPALE